VSQANPRLLLYPCRLWFLRTLFFLDVLQYIVDFTCSEIVVVFKLLILNPLTPVYIRFYPLLEESGIY